MTAKNNGGVGAATIAFGVSGGGCSSAAAWNRFSAMPATMCNFINNGGKLILSFGGAAGTYLERRPARKTIWVNLLRKAIDSHGIRAIALLRYRRLCNWNKAGSTAIAIM